jgi:rhamnulokinase
LTHLAIDLGATSGRVSYGFLRDDKLKMVEVARFRNAPLLLGGLLYWDLAQLFGDSVRGLKEAFTQLRVAGIEPKSIGIDSWGVDYGLVDGDHSQMVNARHYRSSPGESVERVRKLVSADLAYATTGITPLPINTVYQLADAGERGELAEGSTMLLIPDLWIYWLTGVVGAERSIASTTELLDATTGGWSEDLAKRLGIPRSVLPPLFDTGSLAGDLLPRWVSELGTDLPVAVTRVAEHDTASGVLALPVSQPFAFVSCGSWSLVGQELASPVLTDAARSAGFTNEQGAYGSTLFMRNLSGLWLLEECLKEWNQGRPRPLQLTDVIAEAQDAEPFRNVIDVSDPDFLRSGQLTNRIARNCEAAGQLVPTTRAHVTRCLIESLALAYRVAIHQSERLTGNSVEIVHVIGGGARNELLCQLTSDACERPVLAGPAEATSFGNILVQMISSGSVESLNHARSIVTASTSPRRYLPDPSQRSAWRSASERLTGLQDSRKENQR